MVEFGYISSNSQESTREEEDTNLYKKKNSIANTCVDVAFSANWDSWTSISALGCELKLYTYNQVGNKLNWGIWKLFKHEHYEKLWRIRIPP